MKKNNNSNVNMKGMYISTENDTSNPIEEGFNAGNIWVSIGMIQLEDFLVECL
jgi:hypothetical protein